MIIDIGIKEGSIEYENLMKYLNELKNKNSDINIGVYKDRKEFTTDIDVYSVAEYVFEEEEQESNIVLSDDEKDKIIEKVSFEIFNNYDYSDYNDYIADLIREEL